MSAKRLYVISNSHLDPIWLWNRSSGRNSWVNTVTSTLEILRENKDMKFTCSSAALYRWLEESAPALFEEIVELVKTGRWEIVGGHEVQSDVIISRAEPILRQAEVGKAYFLDKFGVDVKIAYNVDSFGHSAGLPKLLRLGGFTHYVFTRPMEMTERLFEWSSDDGSSITALHIPEAYGHAARCTKDEFMERIRQHIENGLPEQVLFFGVGDHGGGVYRKHLEWLREAQTQYDIVFSTLAEYFNAVQKMPRTTISGELGPSFKGCYSACYKVKHKIARATRRILKAEKLSASKEELEEPWKELLFNHFHDILPGTSILRAYERDIFPAIGFVEHIADTLIDRSLSLREQEQDTRFMPEGGIQLWNPHPFAHKTIVSIDHFSDPNNTGEPFNVLMDENGETILLQYLPTASTFGPCGDPWGRLTAVVGLPPGGERFLAFGRRKLPEISPLGFERQLSLLKKISFQLFYDNTRTWGFGLDKLTSPELAAQLAEVVEFQNGPVCSILRANYTCRNSRITLDLTAYREIPEIGVTVRLDWHETRCCLKFVLAHNLSSPDFYTGTSGCSVLRAKAASAVNSEYPNSGECSMIDFTAVISGKKSAGFFTPDLHSCDHAENSLRISLARPVLYADHFPFPQSEEYGWTEQGVSWRKLWYFEGENVAMEDLPRMAEARLVNGETREVTWHAPHPDGKGLNPLLNWNMGGKTTLPTSARRGCGTDWLLTFCNYGEAENITLPNGKTLMIGPHQIQQITFSDTEKQNTLR